MLYQQTDKKSQTDESISILLSSMHLYLVTDTAIYHDTSSSHMISVCDKEAPSKDFFLYIVSLQLASVILE